MSVVVRFNYKARSLLHDDTNCKFGQSAVQHTTLGRARPKPTDSAANGHLSHDYSLSNQQQVRFD